jgi:putative FmdB family regulatory protein
MPTYEYKCDACGKELEIEQRITAPKLEICPACNEAKLVRLISRGNFILKGGGWYADLYSKPPGSGGSSSSASGSASTPSAPSAPAPSTPSTPSGGSSGSSGSST